MQNYKLIFLALAAMILAACAPKLDETPILTVMTHDSFAISEQVILEFESEYNVDVVFIKLGDTGEAVNKAVLAAGNPLADVFYGVDNSFLSRALDGDIFEMYASPQLAELADEFKLDPTNHALPINFGDVCINIDKAYFADSDLDMPSTLDDLLAEEYADLLVVQNPATSSPGLAFLLATIGTYGESGYLDYWAALRENGLKVVNDWERAYYTEFSQWGGAYPLVVSYSSSPPAEVIFAETALDDAPTTSMIGAGSCFRQIEFAGILRGTEQRELAEDWIDFMLSLSFQEDLPLQMFVFPVLDSAKLPPEFISYATLSDFPVNIEHTLIAENREHWITAWAEEVLR
jgi:thiamine transport system substrate-binding protein